jgi:hypothetical protein
VKSHEEVARIGPRHAQWVSISARTTDQAAASEWVHRSFQELLVEAAAPATLPPGSILASLRRSATQLWPQLGCGDTPELSPIPDEDRQSEVCAQYDPILRVVEIDVLALEQLALLLGHIAPPGQDLASLVAVDPCYVAARSLIPAALACPPGQVLLHELVHAATPSQLRSYDVASDGPIVPASFASYCVLQRPFRKELVDDEGSGLVGISPRYAHSSALAEAATEAKTRRLWPYLATAFEPALAAETPPEIRGGLEAYPAWRLVDGLFPGDDLEGLFSIDATLDDVLARIEPRIAPARRGLLARSLGGVMTTEDEASGDGIALSAAGWETVADWVIGGEAMRT